MLKILLYIQIYLLIISKKIRIRLLKIKLAYTNFSIILVNLFYNFLEYLLNVTLYLIQFTKIHIYIWTILLTIISTFISIFYKSWPYKDYMWLCVIISLLITSIYDNQEETNENEY